MPFKPDWYNDPFFTSDRELDQPSFNQNPYLRLLAGTGRFGGGASTMNPVTWGYPGAGGSSPGANPLAIAQTGVNLAKNIPTLANVLRGGGGAGTAGPAVGGALGTAGAAGVGSQVGFGSGMIAPTGAQIAAGPVGALPFAEAGPALAGEAGAGAGGALGALAPFSGPLAIALASAGAMYGDRLNFNADKDRIRQEMLSMGPEAAMNAVLAQAGGDVRWRSPSDATSPLGLLDSWGDVFGRANPTYQRGEDVLFSRALPPGGREVTEAELPGIMGDAGSAGVLAERGEELMPWRSHPERQQRYGYRRTPEPEALERDIETQFAQGRGTQNYSQDQGPRLSPELRAAFEERNPDVAARTRARLNPRPLMQAGEA